MQLIHMSLARNRFGNRLLIPRQHHHATHTKFVQIFSQCPRLGPNGIGHDHHRLRNHAVALTQPHPHAGLAHLLQWPREIFYCFKSTHLQLTKQTLTADDHPQTINISFRALAGGGLEIRHLGRCNTTIQRTLHDGMGQRMLGLRLKRCCQTQQADNIRRQTRTQDMHTIARDNLRQRRLAHGQRSGLVDSDNVDQGRTLKVRSTLDQNPPPRCTTNRRQHGRRRADDQGTRRGNHHQRHRTVKRIGKIFSHRQKWNEKNSDRECNHAHRIILLRTLKKPLCARLFRLCFRHELDHSRKRGVLRPLGHPQFNATTLIERPCKQQAANGL